jgi:hypothetical protein
MVMCSSSHQVPLILVPLRSFVDAKVFVLGSFLFLKLLDNLINLLFLGLEFSEMSLKLFFFLSFGYNFSFLEHLGFSSDRRADLPGDLYLFTLARLHWAYSSRRTGGIWDCTFASWFSSNFFTFLS